MLIVKYLKANHHISNVWATGFKKGCIPTQNGHIFWEAQTCAVGLIKCCDRFLFHISPLYAVSDDLLVSSEMHIVRLGSGINFVKNVTTSRSTRGNHTATCILVIWSLEILRDIWLASTKKLPLGPDFYLFPSCQLWYKYKDLYWSSILTLTNMSRIDNKAVSKNASCTMK